MTEEERAKAGDEEKISLRLDLNFFFFFTIRKYDSFDLVRNLSNRILKFCNEINFIRNVSQFSNDLNKKFKNIFTRDCNILCQNFHRRNIFNNALVISKNDRYSFFLRSPDFCDSSRFACHDRRRFLAIYDRSNASWWIRDSWFRES